MKLNENTVGSLPKPTSGNRVHYFPDATVQGQKTPRGFGVRVTAAGVRSFVMNYRIANRERRYTIGQWPDWKVVPAIREARELRKRIDRGEDPLSERRAAAAASDNTLKVICKEYLSREGGKLRTTKWRERILVRLVYPELGDRAIEDIRRSDLVRLLDRIEDDNGPVMADRTLAIVRKIMNWHASRSDEFRSPIVRDMARTKPKERARSRTLSDDELRALWRAAEKAEHQPFGALVQFILLTGARRAEAAEMSWSEIEHADWTLPASRNKTKVDLVRPLSKAVLAALPAKIDGCAFVFTTDGRNPVSGFSTFKRKLDQQCGVSGWTLHDLRRTSRSLMSRAGVNPDIAERCLGHAIPGVRGVYDRHQYRQEMARAYEVLAAQIDLILKPPATNVTPLRKGRGRM
jgi:integrase